MKSKRKLPQSTPESRAKAKKEWKERNMSGGGPRRDKKIKKAETKATQWKE